MLLRHKPVVSYCGLTIILSNPSRFDRNTLLNAGGGRLIDECLRPHYNRGQCDIRVKDDTSPLLDGTKCILLLGEPALRRMFVKYKVEPNPILGAVRGTPHDHNNIVTIPTFFPQDAIDIMNHEKSFNPLYDNFIESDDEEEQTAVGEKSRHGRTRRKNYRFWISKDIERCKQILDNNGQIPKRPFEPKYIIAPSSQEILPKLLEAKNELLFIDTETFYPLPDMQCISISFGYDSPIYVLPILLHDYSWGYGNLPVLLRGISVALRDNTVIAHNGAHFDFLYLANQYKLAIGPRVHDTMIMQHRCFSDVEKSLGHCMSIWTWEQFHKDEGEGGYNNIHQCRAKWEYCGKDVYGMKLIHHAMMEYAKTHRGLEESFRMANDAIRPYIIQTLTGMKFDEQMRQETIAENDALMTQYIRLSKILIGEEGLKQIAGKSKKPMMGSNTQCCKYFHDMLGYKPVAYGEVKKDGSRGPSLGKKAMLKLKLKHNNPVIDLCLAYREVAKETGTLGFTPWKT